MADSKKMTKGTVAIAAGVVLLLGGAGTYALWEVSESIDGNVQTGDLNLTLGDATWTLNGEVVDDLADVRIVPGDTLALQQGLEVTATGDDLEAQLSLSENADFIPEGLEEHLAVSFDVDVDWLPGVGDNAYLVPTAEDAHTVAAEVVIEFDSDTPGRVGTNTDLDLNGLEFTLEQLSSGN